MAFKSSTDNKSPLHIVREMEAIGGNVTASASREQMSYRYDALDWEVKEQIQKVKADISECANNPETLLLDNTILEQFESANCIAPRIVLAASDVEHEQLLEYEEPLLFDLPGGAQVEEPKSVYVSGDHRVIADPGRTSFALAFKFPGGWLNMKDAMTLTVLQVGFF